MVKESVMYTCHICGKKFKIENCYCKNAAHACAWEAWAKEHMIHAKTMNVKHPQDIADEAEEINLPELTDSKNRSSGQ